jgi:hypothetical protein
MQIDPRRRYKLALVVFSVLAGLRMLAAVPVRADDSSSAAAGVAGVAAMGAVFLFMAVIGIAFYVYFALALQTIAKKTNTPDDWWAWVPIMSAILMLNVAKKPLWWIILFFIPFVNIVIIIITFMAIAEARNKPSWWGILMIVPVANLIVPGYLAWAD